MKLFDSELKVMEVLWERGPLTASQIASILKASVDWNPNTTYTVIKKCIAKGAIRRDEPKFRCTPLISRKDVQQEETEELIDRMFAGSKHQFFAALLSGGTLSDAEIEELRQMIAKGKQANDA